MAISNKSKKWIFQIDIEKIQEKKREDRENVKMKKGEGKEEREREL